MNLSDWIERHAAFTPDKPAIRFEGAEISYAAFADRIERLAAMLKDRLKVGRGDRVAHLGANTPEFLDLLFACARLGAMLVPLNWRLAAPEHEYILADAGADVLLADAEYMDHVDGIRSVLADMAFVTYGEPREGWQSYAALLEATAPSDATNPHVDLSAPFLIVYTSGTTGRPKGAVLRQEALFWNAVNSAHMHDMTAADHVLTVLPLFHVGGLNNQTTPALHLGATVTLHRRFDPGATLAAIRDDRPTLTVLVPATIQAMLDHPEWERTDLGCLRSITTGSTIVPVPLIEACHARGVPVIQVYGSTETAPIAIYQRREGAERSIGSTGKPALHCEVRIVDDEGRPLPHGERGEIAVRGPNVMYEYWGDADATRAALVDGWFHTGDIGCVDEAGDYWVVERKKDVIISGSENIYPAELEAVLHDCPELADAAIVARPDAKWGEVPVATVVRRQGSTIGPEDVLALFEGRLARYKHPHDVIFMETLPRNAMGKILKYRLREMVG